MKNTDITLYNSKKEIYNKNTYISSYSSLIGKNIEYVFNFFNNLNKENYHKFSKDDECTPMECVKEMVDYIPKEFWKRESIKILDPCAGNGNFPAYLMFKTDISNIWLNDLNEIRIKNAESLLETKNIYKEDFLNSVKLKNIKWDLIIANPPYSGGRNKNTSISNQFIEKSIGLLNDCGYLCFITPNNWMTYNNNNTTLKKLLNNGSFIIIDNDVKRYFPKVGSSFTVFVWQKNIFTHKTKVINNYIIKDIKKGIVLPKTLPFIPLYISQEIIDIIPKVIFDERNSFDYRCDLHNYTKKEYLRDVQGGEFIYETIHTTKITRYANFKQDIYNKWIIVVPLSTYYIPYIKTNVNITQSVGYIPFNTKKEAELFLEIITQPIYKVFIHLTRYGNFNNIKVLRHLAFGKHKQLTKEEEAEIIKISNFIRY